MAAGSGALRHYAIAGGREGKQRLDLLARVHREATLDLLRAAGVRTGMRCLDLGCGGGHVALEMARLVGRFGRVVAVDADPEVVLLARADVRAAGAENVDVEVGSAVEDMPGRPFHVAYARFLLSHLPQPERVVARMVAALEAGGVAVVEDVDFRGAFCFPASRAFERSLDLYRAVVRHRGGDADIGPRLPSLLRAAGLDVIGVRVVQPAFLAGEGKLIPWLTLEKVREAIAEAGLATRREIADTLRELKAFSERSDSLVAQVRTVQVLGRKIT